MSLSVTRQTVPVEFAGQAVVVGVEPDESILFAGLKAGIPLPYECASGGCGACRARLVSGSVTSRWEQATGLTDRDRRKGDRILLCQSVAATPCQVQAVITENAGRGSSSREPLPVRTSAQVLVREFLSADTARFVVVTGEPLPYLPGQFVLLEFGDGVRRAYSMSRPMSADEPDRLELLIRAKPGGAASEWLFDRVVAGSVVTVEGPYGKAYAQSPPERPVLCLAGGTGLAPVLAIAEHLITESPQRPLAIYVGARTAPDLVLTDRLGDLVARGARVVPVAEEVAAGSQNGLGEIRAGFALAHVDTDWTDLSGHDLYVAGPAPMIDATLKVLVRSGRVAADRVFFDRFLA